MGMKRLFFVFLFLSLSVNAFATFVAVLETGADADAKENVSLSDRQYLTNVLRAQAVKELPAIQDFTIMTRENILQMLPPGKAIEDCEGSCLVETGKNIAADYIAQARVGRFGSSLTISAELYETAGNKLVASFNGRGENVERLLELIEREGSQFFRVVRDMTRPAVGDVVEKKEESVTDSVSLVPVNADTVNLPAQENLADSANSVDSAKTDLAIVAEPAAENASLKADDVSGNKVGESIPANVNSNDAGVSAKKSGIHWMPLSISAAATVAGAVLTVVGNSKAKKASEKKYSTEAEYKKYHDDAKSGQTLRGNRPCDCRCCWHWAEYRVLGGDDVRREITD